MSRTIRAIIRHMVLPSAGSSSNNVPVQPTTAVVLRRKPERKLHIVFAPPPLKPIR
jgi:hypothetical protein